MGSEAFPGILSKNTNTYSDDGHADSELCFLVSLVSEAFSCAFACKLLESLHPDFDDTAHNLLDQCICLLENC